MKLKKNQIKQIIREEKIRLIMEQMDDVKMDSEGAVGGDTDHHWPRTDWSSAVGDIADKWADLEVKAFEPDPSNTKDGELTNAEAKAWWEEQVDAASMDLENELTVEIRKVALAAMKRITSQLLNGEYA